MTERPDQPLPLVSPLAAALDAPLGGTAQPPPPATRTPARTFDELLWQAGNALNRAESVCYVLRSAIVAAGGKPFGQPAPVAADGAGGKPANAAEFAESLAFLWGIQSVRSDNNLRLVAARVAEPLFARLAAAEAARAAAETHRDVLQAIADKLLSRADQATLATALAAAAGAKDGRDAKA